jgi:hypothetical protein
MGTTLTGLTPATTYDALIKVGDNGPITTTQKVIGDGLGNDSPIRVSTTQVGIGADAPAGVQFNVSATLRAGTIQQGTTPLNSLVTAMAAALGI